jgi:hypothetical protein
MVEMGNKIEKKSLLWHLKSNVLSLEPKFLNAISPSGTTQKNGIVLWVKIKLFVN